MSNFCHKLSMAKRGYVGGNKDGKVKPLETAALFIE